MTLHGAPLMFALLISLLAASSAVAQETRIQEIAAAQARKAAAIAAE